MYVNTHTRDVYTTCQSCRLEAKRRLKAKDKEHGLKLSAIARKVLGKWVS